MSKRASLAGETFLPPTESKSESHPVDNFTDYPENQVIELPVGRVTPDPNQPRKSFDQKKLKQLSTSILERGLHQPISVRLTPDREFILVAGERRWRAHKLAGKERIRAIICNIDNVDDAFELSLIENTQRDNLTPLEEAEGLSDLMRRQGYTQKEAGEKIGRDPTQASRLVKLSKLPKAIKAKVATSQLSRDQLFQIASQKNEEAMDQLLKEITERKLNVRETRERANIKPTKKSKTTPALQKLRSSHTFLNKSENTFTGLNSQEKEKALAYLKDIIESSKRVIEHLNKTT
mgnify:FL=1|jgi:ParB family transcriptional regulator, chromosome partitioning protein